MKKLLTVCLWLLLPLTVSAENLLYVRTDGKLYTCDRQTGELTYITDSSLQWIAGPMFDEPHHTALLIGPGRLSGRDGSFYWGNPFTGQSGGAYTASVSASPWVDTITELGAYAWNTERLYAIGRGYYGGIFGEPDRLYYSVMVDQFDRTPIPDWGGPLLQGLALVELTAMCYDRVEGKVILAYTSRIDHGDNSPDYSHGFRSFDPVTGKWAGGGGFGGGSTTFVSTTSIAVDPDDGSLWYTQVGAYSTELTLYRGSTAIATFPAGSWSMNFADAKWAK